MILRITVAEVKRNMGKVRAPGIYKVADLVIDARNITRKAKP